MNIAGYKDEFKKVHNLVCRQGGHLNCEEETVTIGKNITYFDCLDLIAHGGGDLYGGNFWPGDIVLIINNETREEVRRFEF